MTTTTTAAWSQPSASDAAAVCVVGVSPGGFRFTSREICCVTEHEGQNGFRAGRLAIGLASFLSSLTDFFFNLLRHAIGRHFFIFRANILPIIRTWRTHEILKWGLLYPLLI
jgi:hypothetical protein